MNSSVGIIQKVRIMGRSAAQSKLKQQETINQPTSTHLSVKYEYE